MTPAVTVLVPVLGRPQNAQPLVESLLASTDRAQLMFVASTGDTEQIEECVRLAKYPVGVKVVAWPAGPGDYASKINEGFNLTEAPLVLLGADDIRFHPGWLEAVEKTAAKYDCGVIGTNDMANPEVIAGRHATHPVVRRCYIDTYGGVVGEPGMVYWPGYDHNYVDNELVATAQARGCFVACPEARVEHLHWLWKRAVKDDTYVKGARRARDDARLFRSRQHLWLNERAAV